MPTRVAIVQDACKSRAACDESVENVFSNGDDRCHVKPRNEL